MRVVTDKLRLCFGVLVLGSATCVFGQYAGPALLSRGEAPAAAAQPTIALRPFAEVAATYDTGLAGVSITPTGEVPNNSSLGARLAFGVSGTHRWRRTNLGLTYRGSITHYTRQTYFDSMSHTLLLNFKHSVSRHVEITGALTGGMFSRDFGLLGIPQTSLYDPSAAYIPRTDYFDNRTIYLTYVGGVTMQPLRRLSVSFNGTGVLNRRRSSALSGVTGGSVTGDAQYRVSRRATIGGDYSFTHFSYSAATMDAHTERGTFAIGLSPRLEFSAYGGISRLESKSITSIRVDPVIAALLGISTASQIVHKIDYLPAAGARISWRIPRAIVFASARTGFTPGNGLFLTSSSMWFTGGYTYTGLRRWSASAQAAYDLSKGLIGPAVGRYRSTSGMVTLSRKLIGPTHFILTYSARRYESPDYVRYARIVNQASVGIGFTPGEVPLRVW